MVPRRRRVDKGEGEKRPIPEFVSDLRLLVSFFETFFKKNVNLLDIYPVSNCLSLLVHIQMESGAFEVFYCQGYTVFADIVGCLFQKNHGMHIAMIFPEVIVFVE